MDLETATRVLRQLIAFDSVSRDSNADVAAWVETRLRELGFEVESTGYRDDRGVQKVNLLARRGPGVNARDAWPEDHAGGGCGLAYFCHTDVVPADEWVGPGGAPFRAVIDDDRVYGRGACDMKGSLAAMLAACGRVSAGQQSAPLWVVCTADEEVGFEGAKRLVRESPGYRELVAARPASIIGEPTRLSVVHAHKGIQAFRITSPGRAAHSSSDEGLNANLAMVPLLQTLLEVDGQTRTDIGLRDDRFDPPTLSWNFGVSDGCRAVNVTPARSVAWVSYRTMPGVDADPLVERVREQADRLGLTFQRLAGGDPMWIDADAPFIREMATITGSRPHTVSYSTDGGQFDELPRRVVCGPGDIAQAHTADEWISLDQLGRGVELYERLIRRYSANARS